VQRRHLADNVAQAENGELRALLLDGERAGEDDAKPIATLGRCDDDLVGLARPDGHGERKKLEVTIHPAVTDPRLPPAQLMPNCMVWLAAIGRHRRFDGGAEGFHLLETVRPGECE
jgi:hypothetical protein